MVRLYNICFIFGLCFNLNAQQILDFEMCRKIALENNLQIKRTKSEAQTNKIGVENAKHRFLPTANGFLSTTNSWGRGIDPFTNTYANQQFASYNAGLNINLNVFNGGADLLQLKLQKQELNTQFYNQQKAINDLTIELFTKYIQSLYFQELHLLSEHQIAISEEIYNNTIQRIDKGQLAKNEKFKISAQIESEKWNALNLKNQWDQNFLDLKFLMNYDSLFQLKNTEIIPFSYIRDIEDLYVKAEKNFPILKAREEEIARAKTNKSLIKSEFYPKLNLNFGTGTTYSTFNRFLNFQEQIDNNWNKQIQLTANVPIFNQLSIRNRAKQADVAIEIAEINKQIEIQNVKRVLIQSYNNLSAAYLKYNSSDAQLKDQEINLKNDRIRFEVGRIGANEYNNSKRNYQTALSNLIRDKYEWYIQYYIIKFYLSETE
jgi:outer membrane protein